MDDLEIKKNVLDLEYQFHAHKINASLLILTAGILSFISTFIWYRERIFLGIGFSAIIIMVSLIFYNSTKRKMFRILRSIIHLKNPKAS